MKIYTNIGYQLPNFAYPFATETPELLGIADSVTLTPFLSASYFIDQHPEMRGNIVNKIEKGPLTILGMKGHPTFVVRQEFDQLNAVAPLWMFEKAAIITYACIQWDEALETYVITEFVPGSEWALKKAKGRSNIIIKASVTGMEYDETIRHVATGEATEDSKPYTRIAFGLPWRGPILKHDSLIMRF